MTCYYISHKDDVAADSYWVRASDCNEARQLIAANVPEASDVKNVDCVPVDDSKCPLDGFFIHRRLMGPVAIKG